MRRIRLLLGALVVACALPATPARAGVAVVVADGRGWGHGVGMAQDGAYWMGERGATHDQILDHFYRGTGRGSVDMDARVVVLVAAEPSVVLDFPDGGELRSPRTGPQHRGFPVRVAPGGSATVRHDGTYRVTVAGGTVGAAQADDGDDGGDPVRLPTSSTSSTSSTSTSSTSSTSTTSTTSFLPVGSSSTTTTTTTPSSPPSTTPGAGPTGPGDGSVRSTEPVWAGPTSAGASIGLPARGLRYRGELEVSVGTGQLRVVNELDLEQYLWGLGEVSASWSPAALRAQVVAARTYATRALVANGEICDTQRCQVYRGRNGEFPGQVDAVNATLGTVLTFGDRYASAVFSANAGGISATPSEGFGTSDTSHPYLQAARYETRSDDPWEVRIALADLARRVGYTGTAMSARVATTGPSGRALTVEIDGDAGPVTVPALEVDRAMGLRSTMWSLRVVDAEVAPPAPDAKSVIQAAPDDVGKVIAEETARVAARPLREDAMATGVARPVPPPGVGDAGGAGGLVPVAVAVAAGVMAARHVRAGRRLAAVDVPPVRSRRARPLQRGD